MFNTYDIRGICNLDLNDETVYKIGFFLRELHDTTKIAVCRDFRESSEKIYTNLINGILDSGADVYDYGVTTTPMSYYISSRYGYDATVMISAAFNEYEYNCIKITGKDATVVEYDNGLCRLEKLVKEGKISLSSNNGKLYTESAYDEYISFMKNEIKFKKNINAVIDLSSGAACAFSEKIFGDHVKYIHNSAERTFDNRTSNPQFEKERKKLSETIKSTKADVGIIFDSDADRVMFLDDKGKFISPDMITSLLSYYLLDGETKEKIILDLRSSKACSFYIREMGSSAIVLKVGQVYIKKRMREEDALLGGELSGHYFFRNFFYCDSGILTAIYVMNAVSDLKNENIRLSDIIQEFTIFSHSGELNFNVEKRDSVIEKIKKHYINENYMKFYDFDGIRFDFDEWWFSLRKSNTDECIRLVVEADTKDIMHKKVKELTNLIDNA